jgi:hypothetical protein
MRKKPQRFGRAKISEQFHDVLRDRAHHGEWYSFCSFTSGGAMITLQSIRSTVGILTSRALGAAVLDRGTYETVEHDSSATWQAAVVVISASVAAGIGATGGKAPRISTLLAVSSLALVTWVTWATLILQIGGRDLPEPQTQVDLGQLLRTLGFAASPGLFQVFAVVPAVTGPVFLASWLWMLGAMTVAVRQALDYRGMGRALAVCAIALVVVVGLAIVLAFLFGPAAA